MAKTTATKKSKTAKPTAKKRTTTEAARAANRNGTPMGRMSEKSKQLTLRAFRKVYESYHRKPA